MERTCDHALTRTRPSQFLLLEEHRSCLWRLKRFRERHESLLSETKKPYRGLNISVTLLLVILTDHNASIGQPAIHQRRCIPTRQGEERY